MLPPKVALRAATSYDDEFLLALYASTRSEELKLLGWDEAQKNIFVRMQFNAQGQQYSFAFPDAEHQIILVDGQPIGRMLVNRTAGEIRLVDIALMPEHRSGGIGTSLLEELLREAAETARPVRLQVQKTNRAAALYGRMGFSPVSDNGAHLVMEWRPES